MSTISDIKGHPRILDWRAIAGALVVLVSRLASFPRTPWEADEFLFLQAVRHFSPLRHHPHPPGYPLFVGLGKVFNVLIRDEFASLVALSIIACVIGFVALYAAFRRMTNDANVALAGSLIFYLSAGMLIHSPLALSDATALMFLALTFHAISGEPTDRRAALTAIWASAAIGCRPQLAIPLMPALIVAIVFFRTWRQRVIAIVAFTIVCALWLAPLIVATDGFRGFLDYELGQARYVAAHDAAASRGSKTILRVAARFFLRAWGSTINIAAIALLCVAGVMSFLRAWHRAIIPLVVFTFIHLGFAVMAMDPADAVRYSLPALPLFALVAALGIVQLRIPAWIGASLLALLAFWYVSPILIERVTSPSPIVGASRFIHANMPGNTTVLYQAGMRGPVDWLLGDYRRRFLERSLRRTHGDPAIPAIVLMDGNSIDPDAHVFRWQPSEAYVKMTRNFGRVISVDPLRPEERYTPLEGVFALETTPDDHEWRWLAPIAKLTFPAIGKQSVAFTFDLSRDAPYDANEVHVLVDGRDAGQAIVTKKLTTITVPFGTNIEIRSARSFRPADTLHNQDKRLLAIELVAIEQR